MSHLIYNLITTLPLIYPKFTIFLILLNIYILLLYLNKKSENKSSQIIPNENIFSVIKPYYLEDLWITIMLISFYFMITVGIFLSLRMYNIGYIRSLQDFNISITFIDISIFVLFIYCIGLYKTLLSQRLSMEIFKLYLYIRSTTLGQKVTEDLWHLYTNSLRTRLSKVSLFLGDIDTTNSLENRLKGYTILYEEDRLIPLKYRIRAFISKYAYLGKVIHIIQSNFFPIIVYWPIIYKYSIHFMLFLVLLYDLKQKTLYYIYIALPVYMVIILYKKVRVYIGQTDYYLYDNMLVNYFYKSTPYKPFTSYISLAPEAHVILDNESAIKAYISREYKADYIPKEPDNTIYDKIVRKAYILLGLSILSWYVLFNTTIYNTCILTIPLAIIYSTSNLTMLISNMWQTLNKIMMACILGITGWVYLTRTSLIYMRDTIWDYYIVITQTFTIREKLEYLENTLSLCTSITPSQKEYLLHILDIEFIQSLITEETTLSQLKEYVENLAVIYIKLENAYLYLFYTLHEVKNPLEPFPFDLIDLIHGNLRIILEAYPGFTKSIFLLLIAIIDRYYSYYSKPYLIEYPNLYERLYKLIKEFFKA